MRSIQEKRPIKQGILIILTSSSNYNIMDWSVCPGPSMEWSSEARLKRIHCIRMVSAGHLGPGSVVGV